MDSKFRITWEVDDGYAGGAAPQYASIRDSDIDEDVTDDDLRIVFWDAVKDDFEQKVSYHSKDEGKFLDWAKGVIQKRKTENV